MQRDEVSVEANLLAKRDRMRAERGVMIREEPSNSTANAKIDSLVRNMEIMMERIKLNEIIIPREIQPAL